MLLGEYPFRCMQCGGRFWASIWMRSQLFAAKCPKCLRTDLLPWPEKYFRPTLWRRLQYTLGAHRYRCEACRHNFVSFRPRLTSSADLNTPRPLSNSAQPEP